MATYKKYIHEITKRYGYHATWTPDTPLKLGDIGLLENGVFSRLDNLENRGFTMKIRKDDTVSDLEYQSKKSVKVNLKTSASVAPTDSALTDADAGFSIGFGKEGGVFLKADGVLTHSIDNQLDLRTFILDKFKNKDWEKNWIVVTELKVADAATVLYSSSSDAHIDIKVKADVGTEKLSLTNTQAGLEITKSKNMDVKIIAKGGVTPLFKALGVKKKLFKTEVGTRGGLLNAPPPEEEFSVDEVAPE